MADAISNEEKYGSAWLLIIGQKQKLQGLKMMKELDQAGFIEGTIALSMFTQNPDEQAQLIEKAALAGNIEGIWEYCANLPHAYCPDPRNSADARWERYCLQAAEGGSADAMNEMGNVFHRRHHYSESMYWYVMANSHDHPGAMMGMSGIAREWAAAGCPRKYMKGSPRFDADRHTCAVSYLELHSRTRQSTDINDLIKLTLKGVPIAGYLTGDIFENIGNEEMAYRMYNALAFENDPHGLKCCADMLFFGKGVARNSGAAYKMYSAAAAKGERSAMFILGEFNKSVNKNIAAYWYGLAHTRGYEPALQRMIQLAQ